MGTELAVGVGAHVVLVGRGIGVFGAHVEIECLALEESLTTDLTCMGHLLFVAFHMVIHGVLLLLHDAAGGADEVTGFIANVFAHFGTGGRRGVSAAGRIQFFAWDLIFLKSRRMVEDVCCRCRGRRQKSRP